MRLGLRTILITTVAGIGLAGCNESSPPAGNATATRGGTETAPMPKTAPDKPELIDISFAGLDAAVAQNKGKVVLLDVWADFCEPCKKKFPHLVELQNRHAKDGLVVITLTIDAKEDKPKAIKFLTDKHAPTVNFFLDDTEENKKKWEDKYPVEQLPVLMVMNRKGERVLTDFGKIEPGKLDELVEKLLAEK
jgi:thiol-disulfide isomerase/thioredoxin